MGFAFVGQDDAGVSPEANLRFDVSPEANLRFDKVGLQRKELRK